MDYACLMRDYSKRAATEVGSVYVPSDTLEATATELERQATEIERLRALANDVRESYRVQGKQVPAEVVSLLNELSTPNSEAQPPAEGGSDAAPWQVAETEMLDDNELLRRAVTGAENKELTDLPRWSVVRGIFGVGSTSGAELCRRFDCDPDEILKGANDRCHECDEYTLESDGYCCNCSGPRPNPTPPNDSAKGRAEGASSDGRERP